MTRYFVLLIFIMLITEMAAQPSHFVQVRNTRFLVNKKPYHYIGTNYWYAGLLGNDEKNKTRLRYELDFLKKNGVNNLRVLVGAEGEGLIIGTHRVGPSLQPRQGIFNTVVLTGLDYLLVEMGRRKMKAVLFISNNWEWSGGFLQYLHWNGLVGDSLLNRKLSWDETRDYVSKFYSCADCIRDYKKQLQLVVNRTNTITQKKYADDTAIMAWEIANEPRLMRPEAIPYYKTFLSIVAADIKAADKNHLVTIGAEGDIGTENMQVFEDIHADKNIDYLTIHIWPKNWAWYNGILSVDKFDTVLVKTTSFIDKHIASANKLGKPLVIEEFGLPRDGHVFSPGSATSFRDAYYKSVFSVLEGNGKANNPVAGCNFWAFNGKARPIPGQLFWKQGDDYMGDPPMEEQGLYGVFDSDKSTWMIIRSFAKKCGKGL